MDTAYSTIAVKYVGSTPALAALDDLRGLRADGSVTLRDAVAVTRAAGGEVQYHPVRPLATKRVLTLMGLAGSVLGLFLGGRLRWSVPGAVLGVVLGWVYTMVRYEEMAAKTPYVEKNESMLFMQIDDADWPAFWWTMQRHMDQGLMVLRTLAPGHAAELDAIAQPAQGEVEPRATSVEPGYFGAEDEAPDDFTVMRGIGPVINKRLHIGGVRTFAQLASLDADQIAQVAGVSARRVAGNDWIGQAKALLS